LERAPRYSGSAAEPDRARPATPPIDPENLNAINFYNIDNSQMVGNVGTFFNPRNAGPAGIGGAGRNGAISVARATVACGIPPGRIAVSRSPTSPSGRSARCRKRLVAAGSIGGPVISGSSMVFF